MLAITRFDEEFILPRKLGGKVKGILGILPSLFVIAQSRPGGSQCRMRHGKIRLSCYRLFKQVPSAARIKYPETCHSFRVEPGGFSSGRERSLDGSLLVRADLSRPAFLSKTGAG